MMPLPGSNGRMSHPTPDHLGPEKELATTSTFGLRQGACDRTTVKREARVQVRISDIYSEKLKYGIVDSRGDVPEQVDLPTRSL